MGFSIANPVEDERRGGHVSLEHEEAVRISRALKEAGIIPDFRAPNILRLAPVAFYTTYVEVWESVQILKTIMLARTYEKFENKRGVVA
jgi:kynureninase